MKKCMKFLLVLMALTVSGFSQDYFSLEQCREKNCADAFNNDFSFNNETFINFRYPTLTIERQNTYGVGDDVKEFDSQTFTSSEVKQLAKLGSLLLKKNGLEVDKSTKLEASAIVGKASAKGCAKSGISKLTGLNSQKVRFLCKFGSTNLTSLLQEVYYVTNAGDLNTEDYMEMILGGTSIGFSFQF